MKNIILLLLLCMCTNVFSQSTFTLTAPGGKLEVNISVGRTIQYSVSHAGDLILSPSPISMMLDNGMVFGLNCRLSGSSTKTVNQLIETPIYKRKTIIDKYNELTFNFKDGFKLVFRAYDEGIAYRFISTLKKPFKVKDEQAVFNFPSDYNAFIPYVYGKYDTFEEQYFNSFENIYEYAKLSAWKKNKLAFLPLVVENMNGKKVGITEADLISYPGMFLYSGDTANSLKGVFAPYPEEVSQGGYNMIQSKVLSRKDYIAQYSKGGVEFPWRVIIVAEDDYQLVDNDMVYKLSTPACKDVDYSWVKPGKVAWEWWNDWNLFNVDFKTGINNQTYKYYIDFASKYGIE